MAPSPLSNMLRAWNSRVAPKVRPYLPAKPRVKTKPKTLTQTQVKCF